jgi:hypothetical protein
MRPVEASPPLLANGCRTATGAQAPANDVIAQDKHKAIIFIWFNRSLPFGNGRASVQACVKLLVSACTGVCAFRRQQGLRYVANSLANSPHSRASAKSRFVN